MTLTASDLYLALAVVFAVLTMLCLLVSIAAKLYLPRLRGAFPAASMAQPTQQPTPYRNPGPDPHPADQHPADQHLALLGLKVQDKVTGREGIVTSVCFDLFGCIQAAVDPGYKDDGSRYDCSWFDVNRLNILNYTPVMQQPPFSTLNSPIAQGEHGPADKPAPGCDMAITSFGEMTEIKLQGLIALLSHPAPDVSLERAFQPLPQVGHPRQATTDAVNSFHFGLEPHPVPGGTYTTKLCIGSVDFQDIRQALLPLLEELLARRNNRDVRQEHPEPETFMGEPVVRGYEVQREQVHALFKLLGLSGTAEVHQIMAKAIERLSPSQSEQQLAVVKAMAAADISDDESVDAFAAKMKAKMAASHAKGRRGWQLCSREDLSRMLREHVEKGDPVDVANFCMMLSENGYGIAKQEENQ